MILTYFPRYDNNINNTVMLSEDSHANWVADLTWRDGPGVPEYSLENGSGAYGVEFASTAVSAQSIVCTNFDGGVPMSLDIAGCSKLSEQLVEDNGVSQWQEGYYRGYYELHVSPPQLEAKYYVVPTVRRRNGWEILLANFTVESGANKLRRPLGPVRGGYVRGGE